MEGRAMEWLSRRLGLYLGLAFALASLVALLSFAPQDPTFTNLRFPKDGIANWLGYPGALAAGSLVEAFGWATLLLPCAVLYWMLCTAAARVSGFTSCGRERGCSPPQHGQANGRTRRALASRAPA
jgi:hypothetical protein